MHPRLPVRPAAARSKLRSALVALILCASALPAAATLYKWTDANGRVVYSDQPPPGDTKWEVVQGAAPPANPNAVKEMAAKELELKKRGKDAADKEKKDEQARADAVRRNEQCTRAEGQMRQLSSSQVALVRMNEKGETVYVDDATRRREREELAVWMQKNCTPGASATPAK